MPENKIPVNIPGGIPSILDGAGAIKDIVTEDSVNSLNDKLDEYETEQAIKGNKMVAVDAQQFMRNIRTKPIERDYLKIGRNDPCPCGSGKKYKNCCLRSGKYETTHQKGE